MLAYVMRGTMPKMCKNALISVLAVAILVLLLVDFPGTIRGPREAFLGSSDDDKENPYQPRLDQLQDHMDSDSYKEQKELAYSGPASNYLTALRKFTMTQFRILLLNGGKANAIADMRSAIESLDMVLGESGGSSSGGFSSWGSSDSKDSKDSKDDDSKKDSDGWSPF